MVPNRKCPEKSVFSERKSIGFSGHHADVTSIYRLRSINYHGLLFKNTLDSSAVV